MSHGTDKYLSLTREQLYELVWSKPGSKLSAELGVSDVAIGKRCRKLNVPRPSRGYWAILTAGGKPHRQPLPPTVEELAAKALKKPVGKRLALPGEQSTRHSMAVELAKMLEAAKPDSDKRVRVSVRVLPKVTVTKELAERAVQAVHTVLQAVEARYIPFRKARSSYETAYFEKGNDRLGLEIEEKLADKPLERSGRARAWSSRPAQVPSGFLTFSLHPGRYGAYHYGGHRNAPNQIKQWSEDGKSSLERVLAQVVQGVIQHYEALAEQRAREAVEEEKRRVAEAERRQREREAEAIRERRRQEEEHPDKLEAAARHRVDDLVKASVWWELHGTVTGFIRDCEQRWRQEQDGGLIPEQEAWLAWAREAAQEMSPFEAGYPDPAHDGAFESAEIPVGGPYPEHRELPEPPTMPKVPPPVVSSGYPDYGRSPEPKPYPFWLKHPGR